jgi:uncharacterized Ntn-hydrolase superfamily protein
MGTAFESEQGELVDRLIASLEAVQSAGGDLRGRRSAAVIVVNAESSGDPAVDVLFNLRVEDHDQPLQELKRLIALKKAFHHNSRGDHHLRNGDVDASREETAHRVAWATVKQSYTKEGERWVEKN